MNAEIPEALRERFAHLSPEQQRLIREAMRIPDGAGEQLVFPTHLLQVVGKALYGWGDDEPNEATGYIAVYEAVAMAAAIHSAGYRRIGIDLYRLREILADLTSTPVVSPEEGDTCLYCDVVITGDGDDESEHKPECSWRHASEMAIALNIAGWVRPELREQP